MKNNEEMPEAGAEAIEFVIFAVGQGRYALPADAVLEVAGPQPVSPIPFMPPYIDGVVNVGGNVLPQLDMRLCLAEEKTAKGGQYDVLVVDSGGMPCALAVDRVLVLALIPSADINAISESPESVDEADDLESEGPRKRFMNCEFMWNELTIVGVDPAALADLFSMVPIEAEDEGILGREVAEARETSISTRKFIIIGAGEERYGFAVEQVLEIVDMEGFTRVPSAPAEVAGIGLLRQNPLLVLSLATLIQGGTSGREAGTVVVVEREDVRYGLLVDQVFGVVEFPDAGIRPTRDGHGLAGVLIENDETVSGWLEIAELIGEQRHALLRTFAPVARFSNEVEDMRFRQLLQMAIGHENFALPIQSIRRVLDFEQPEPFHDAERPWLMGVVDVDGEIVPAIDLGQQLGQGGDAQHGAYVVVGEKHQRWALAVNRVTDIVNIPEDNIEEVADLDSGFVNAVAVHEGELISLLNLKPVFSAGYKPMEELQ